MADDGSDGAKQLAGTGIAVQKAVLRHCNGSQYRRTRTQENLWVKVPRIEPRCGRYDVHGNGDSVENAYLVTCEAAVAD
jgi:hypothetical protein